MSDDFDSHWKEILKGYFPDFMAFVFPPGRRRDRLGAVARRSTKDVAKAVRDAELSRRHADKLMGVFVTDGSECWLLVRIAVRGPRNPVSASP
jgi:hypothetical protein